MFQISHILSRFPPDRESLIPALHTVQNELGYLPDETIKQVSAHFKLSASLVYGVATFYSTFRFVPIGKHCIKVCRGTACHVKGAEQILTELEKKLGVKSGETTPDGEYTLETEACFGSCALAPVVVKDNRVYGQVTPSSAYNILRDRH